jgi:opacity protein-like surface antigen
MKRLLLAAAALALLATSAHAADRVPGQFVGRWCAEGGSDAGTVFVNRSSSKCENAHEPEDIMTIRSDRLEISDMATCKFLETTEVNQRLGAYRLKFWCKSHYETWIYDAWFANPGHGRITVDLIEKEETK